MNKRKRLRRKGEACLRASHRQDGERKKDLSHRKRMGSKVYADLFPLQRRINLFSFCRWCDSEGGRKGSAA